MERIFTDQLQEEGELLEDTFMSEQDKLLHSELTHAVLKAFYHVYNALGYGFLEKVYERAMALTLRKSGLLVQTQKPIKVYFEGVAVGQYFADLLANHLLIVEIKAAEGISEAHEAQLLNYLRATEIEVGLLLNFGLKPAFKRKIFINDRKKHLIVPDNLIQPP